MNHLNESVFDKFPELETRRLRLRQILPEDADAIFQMRSQSAVNRFIARHTSDAGDVKKLLEKVQAAYGEKKGIGWAAVFHGQGRCIGTCGFNRIEYENLRAELGGEMSPALWGRGLALEAVTAIVDFGFSKLNLHSIEARVWPDNRGAIALLEAAGFRKEAHFSEAMYYGERFMDIAVYSKLEHYV